MLKMGKNIILASLLALPLSVSADYTQDFKTSDEFGTMIVIDANNDGITWSYDDNNRCAKIPFNNDAMQDDWLLTPAQTFEAGHKYNIEFTVTGGGFWAVESFSASIGTEATASGMTGGTELISRTTLVEKVSKMAYSASFICPRTGTYYFGIHCTSDIGQSTFRVNGISIVDVPGDRPSAPKMDIIPAANGGLSAQVKVTAPTTDINGATLSELTKMVIYRDGTTVLKTIDNPVPGQEYTTTDIEAYGRLVEFKAVATSARGDGETTVMKKFIGVDMPGSVQNLRVTEDLNEEGTFVLTWDAPETGMNGGFYDDGTVKYYVSAGDDDDVCAGSETTFRYTLEDLSKQSSVTFGVYAGNSAGSERSLWQIITGIAGPAVKAPYTEGFATLQGPWTSDRVNCAIGEAQWFDMTVDAFGGSQDGDNYCQCFFSDFKNKIMRLKSPKVDIRSLSAPKMAFWVFQNGAKDTLTVQISTEFGEWQTLKTLSMHELVGWQKYEIDLTPYQTARFIQAGFMAKNSATASDYAIGLDNVSFRSNLDYDLELLDFTAPSKLIVDQKEVFAVKVRNNGNLTAQKFSIALYGNGEKCAETACEPLDGGGVDTYYVETTAGLKDGNATVFKAKILFAEDQYPENNESEEVNVPVVQPTYSAPSDLKAAVGDDDVRLTWNFDANSGIFTSAVTESFETYETFSIGAAGQWQQYDEDGQNTITMAISMGSDVTVLNYTNAGMPMAFQVMDPAEAGIPYASWDPHNGDKYMAAFRNATNKTDGTIHQNSDWLISPLLCGKAQTISLFAKATMSTSLPEKMEIWYSEKPAITSAEDMEEFEMLKSFDVTNVKAWEEYFCDIPAGAAHFAIRYCSNGKYALLVDDVTYVPFSEDEQNVEFEGFNIYRNNEWIAFTNQPRWVDDEADASRINTYAVTAVFTVNGQTVESAYSNVVTVYPEGIGTVLRTSENGERTWVTPFIYVENGRKTFLKGQHR